MKRHNKFWVYNWENRISTKYSIDLIVTEKVSKIEYFWGGDTSNKKDRVGKESLSQWYMADFNVGHVTYCCIEQYLMLKKALLFGDEESKNRIMESKDQSIIKQLGREVKGFDEEVWKGKNLLGFALMMVRDDLARLWKFENEVNF